MYIKSKSKLMSFNKRERTTNRRFRRLSHYINKEVVDIDGNSLEQNAQVLFDKDDQAMLGYAEGSTDPFANPRMSLFDHVAAAGDPDVVQRIQDSIKANKSADQSTDTTVEE